MSHYLVRWQFSTESVKALVAKPHDRVATARSQVEGFGGKLHSYFFVLGEHDGVALCEFPDQISATAFSMSGAASGTFSRLESIPLLTSQEAEAAMKKAHDTKTSFRPPNA